MTLFGHETGVALLALILTSAPYIRRLALVQWEVNQDGGPRGETFSSRRNLLLRKLSQEGGQDGKDFCL